MDTHPDHHPDWQLVLGLGGPAKVAELLGFSKSGGVQRVQNWKHRGVPSHVKVAHPQLFMRSPSTAQGFPVAGGVAT